MFTLSNTTRRDLAQAGQFMRLAATATTPNQKLAYINKATQINELHLTRLEGYVQHHPECKGDKAVVGLDHMLRTRLSWLNNLMCYTVTPE